MTQYIDCPTCSLPRPYSGKGPHPKFCSACCREVLPLFDSPKLPKNPRPTQIQAAERVAPKVGTQRASVLETIKMRPQTDEEIAEYLWMNPSSVRPRRLELLEGGWIRDSGRTRKTRSGAKAIVWEYVE